MRKQNYFAPAIENISVELEKGIANSAAPTPAPYGTDGAAGASVDETGETTW